MVVFVSQFLTFLLFFSCFLCPFLSSFSSRLFCFFYSLLALSLSAFLPTSLLTLCFVLLVAFYFAYCHIFVDFVFNLLIDFFCRVFFSVYSILCPFFFAFLCLRLGTNFYRLFSSFFLSSFSRIFSPYFRVVVIVLFLFFVPLFGHFLYSCFSIFFVDTFSPFF